jgi:hypothetical protein
VVLIDNIQELNQTFLSKLQEIVERIAQNGSPLGIHLVALLNSPTDTVARVRQQFGVQLGIAVTSDMVQDISGKRKFILDDTVMGRGVASLPACEIQLAAVAEDEVRQVDVIREYLTAMSQNDSYSARHQIRELPERLPVQTIWRKQDNSEVRATTDCVFALNLDTEFPMKLALLNDGPYVLISGGEKSGKSTTLMTWAQLLMQQRTPDQLHIYVMHNGTGPLQKIQHAPHLKAYETNVQRWPQLLERMQNDLEAHRRYFEREHPTPEQMLMHLPMILLLVDSNNWSALEPMSATLHKEMAAFLSENSDYGLYVLGAGTSQDLLNAKRMNDCKFTTTLLGNRTNIVMNIDSNDDFAIAVPDVMSITASQIEAIRQGMRPGRALMVRGQQRVRMQFGVLD